MAKRKYCPNCKQKLTKGESHKLGKMFICTKARIENGQH